jgi:hypothetical protein
MNKSYCSSKNSRNNRKGWINNIQMAILAIAAMVVFTLFLYQMYTGLKERMTIQSCKTSIQAHDFVSRATARDIITDIKCPTNEVTIRNLKTANAVIAEDMHRCWYIWGQGHGQYFQGDGTFCQVCSIYQFGDKRKTVNGFMEYLQTQPIKMKYPGDIQGISYQDYFQGYSTPNSASKVKNNQIQSISDSDFLNTSQKYATIFVYASGKDSIEKALEGGGRITLGSAGLGAALLGVAGGAYGVSALGAAITATAASATAVAAGTATTVAVVNFWNPVGWIVGAGLVIGAGVFAVYKATHPVDPEWVSFMAFRPYTVESLQNLSCEKLAVNQMSNAAP